MSLEQGEVVGRVSSYVESDRIVNGRPSDCRRVVIYSMPQEDTSVVENAHDVVVRSSEDESRARQVEESWGHYEQPEAAERAVEIAERGEATVWDEIISLRYPSKCQ